MSIVPVDRPMTSSLLGETIDQLVKKYPFIRREKLASTAFGRPIEALEIGTGNRKVIFSAAHHANEWITTPVLMKFLEDYADAIVHSSMIGGIPARNLATSSTLYLVPMVNPDGVDLVTGLLAPGDPQYERAKSFARNYTNIPFPDGWKANLNGVDLNLQYPAGWLMAREIKFRQGYTAPAPRDYVGRAPLTQIESAALYDYTNRISPDLVLAYHTQGEVIYYRYGNIDLPEAEALALEFADVSGYTPEAAPYNSSFAGYKDWFIQAFRKPGFTIEAGSGINPLPLSQFGEIYNDNLGILVSALSD